MTHYKRRHRPHAQFHLPPLEISEALLLVEILERAQRAIWRAHGPDMAEYLAFVSLDFPKPPDAFCSRDPKTSDDVDF